MCGIFDDCEIIIECEIYFDITAEWQKRFEKETENTYLRLGLTIRGLIGRIWMIKYTFRVKYLF